jgi:hypothetical protein
MVPHYGSDRERTGPWAGVWVAYSLEPSERENARGHRGTESAEDGSRTGLGLALVISEMVSEVEPKTTAKRRFPSLFELVKFALFAGITFFVAWMAGTGRVAYVFIMLVIASALAYAVLDLVDYEIVKRRKRADEKSPYGVERAR